FREACHDSCVPGTNRSRRSFRRLRMLTQVANPVPESVLSPTSPFASWIGLFEGKDFRLTTGRCSDCAAIPQALWYFEGETIAAPRQGLRVAGFTPGLTLREDLEHWAATHPPDGAIDEPPFVWIGSPEILRRAHLSSDGRFLDAAGQRFAFSV